MQRLRMWLLLLCAVASSASPVYAASDAPEEAAWTSTLKNKYFAGKSIDESGSLLELTAPYRAEDPALVPLQIISKMPQSPDHYIKTITLIIDNNPTPFAAAFHFTPESGKADLAMRVRINSYTYVRAIAETNDGKLSMTKVFVKASGGCSAPIGADMEAAMARMGKMKFKLEDKLTGQQPNLAQVLISHPNITGMQMDQISRLVTPAHYIEEMKISFNGKPVLTAQTDIAISADPNFRFYFVPDKSGELKVGIKDNKGGTWTATQEVKL